MYLKDFYESDASYDDLALELMDMEKEGDVFKEVFSLICLHSDLGELEYFTEVSEMAIHQYDNTTQWRREAGRGD